MQNGLSIATIQKEEIKKKETLNKLDYEYIVIENKQLSTSLTKCKGITKKLIEKKVNPNSTGMESVNHYVENSSIKTKDNTVVSKANSPENQTTSDLIIDGSKNSKRVKCNTKLSVLSKDCTSMYNIYRAEYTYVQNNGGYFNIQTCEMRKAITFKNIIEPHMEEKCDNEIAGFIILNTQTLGCIQPLRQEDFLFKKEYCKKHIR